MADPIIRFNQNTVTGKKKTSASYQIKRYPEGVILYTTSAELPDSLSANALIFTTDTAELYVGTGTGIQKLKLGSEADLNPAIYLKIDSARATYQSKLQAEEKSNEIKEQIATLKESVYSKEDIDKFITEDIDLDGVVDKMNLYTVERINQLLEERAAAADVYTRTQADAIFDVKAEKSVVEELSNKHDNLETTVSDLSAIVDTKAVADNVYTKTEIDTTVADINNSIAANTSAIIALQNNSAVATEVTSRFEAVESDILNLKDTKAEQTTVEAKDQELENGINEISRNLEDFTITVYNKTDVDNKVQTINESIASTDNKISETASNIRNEIATVNEAVVQNRVSIDNNLQDIADNKLRISQTEEDINGLKETVNTKANIDDVYTKAEVSDLLSGKANLDEVFKKIDTYSAEKIQELFAAEDETDLGLFYTKVETDNMLSAKADQEAFAVTEQRALNNKSRIKNISDTVIPGIVEKVNLAAENANSALETANDSKTTANNANNTAIEAKASAESAKTTANEAKTLATNVSSIAESANEKSDIALSTAREAQDAVGEATRAADRLTTRVANAELNVAALRNNMVDAATLATELNKKADVSLLDFKASKVELEQGLSLKANQNDFETLQENAATKTELSVKADTDYVNQKVTDINGQITDIKSDIDAVMDAMADTSVMDNKLALKADASKVYTKEEVDELINDAVTQVLNELAFKLLGNE